MKRFGLKGRSIAFCVVLLLGAVGALSTALIWRQYGDWVAETTEKAVVHARAISYAAEPNVLLNDTKGLEQVVQAASGADEALVAEILSTDGRVLAQFQREGSAEPDIDLTATGLISGETDREAFRVGRTASQLAVMVPIWPDAGQFSELDLGIMDAEEEQEAEGGGPIGFVQLVYSLEGARRALASGVRSSVVIAIMVIIVGIGVTVLMVRQLLTPVRDLVQTATAIADGNHHKRASEQGVGEIGVLARAFNHMAETLGAYTQNLETEVHARTAALAESEARTRAILDTAADGIITIDEQGTIRSFNVAAERIFGYAASEMVGQNVGMLMPARYADAHDTLLANYIRTGDAKVIGHGAEVEGKQKDGSICPLDLAVSEVRLSGRRMFTGIIRDISERKRAEEEQQKLVSLVENSSDFIAMASLDGQVIYVNQAGRELVGLDGLEAARSTTIADYHFQDAWEGLREMVLPAVMKSGQWEGEGHLRHFKTKKPIDVQMSMFLIRHPQSGEPMCFATVQRDIREAKRAERQLKRNMAELEKFNRLAVGRELRMIELKRELNDAARKAGLAEPYDLSFAEANKAKPVRS